MGATINYYPDYQSFLSGIVASWTSIFISQPLDIIKVRMQNVGGSVILTISSLLKQEGFFAFWKAVSSPLVGSTITSSLSLGINENIKKYFKNPSDQTESLKIWQHTLCGSISGVSKTFFSCPFEHVTVKLQVQGKISPRGDPIYKNPRDCFISIYKKYGIVGLYRGFSICLSRDIFGYGIFFAAYQTAGKKLFGGDNIDTHQLPLWQIIMCGGIAGIAYWIGIFGLDVIKSKIQADSFVNPKYKNIKDCIKITWNEGGLAGLSKGWFPAIIRAFPSNAAYMAGFEVCMKALGRDK
ncbi:unnamed protein product [Blepharisma stoltei]|uniref:Mitochondrial carrier protein n=1 Tax=Blepharisma stoltei TaxID=1481888 RepID=A0AAU9ICF3_9CILI|nr:unnamed protein product [Blepharisma stoltei]